MLYTRLLGEPQEQLAFFQASRPGTYRVYSGQVTNYIFKAIRGQKHPRNLIPPKFIPLKPYVIQPGTCKLHADCLYSRYIHLFHVFVTFPSDSDVLQFNMPNLLVLILIV